MTQDSNQVEDLKTFKEENGESWRWNYWKEQLGKSIEESKDYLDESERIVNIFKGNSYRATNQAGDTLQVKPVYNILYSNVETLKPLVFSRLPNPRVRKRNLEKNNINKLISITLERNIKRVLEETDAQNVIEQARDDYLVTKRGVIKVMFEQDIEVITEEIRTPIIDELTGEQTGEDIQAIEKEELGEKKIFLEYVSYKDVVFSCAEKWEDVDWVAFRHYFTKDELKKRFGRKANTINFGNEVASNTLKSEGTDGIFKKAEVWEIWDKETKKVYYYCEGYDKGLLKTVDDAYKLLNFFNIPRPLGIDSGFDKVNCPIQDYKYYEEQAKELDKISNRIIAILPYMSMGGVYNDSLTTEEAETFLQAIERYYPVKMSPDGDIKKMIYERDLSKLAGVLTTLYEERQQTIRAIQEITGISDIVRGQTVAQETATAQELKGNFAVSRLQPMQQEIEFFCRDIVRIIAELLAENYDIVELVQAAGFKIFDMDELVEKFTKELEDKVPPEQFGQALQAKLKPYANEIKAGQATSINNIIAAAKILKSDKLRGWAIEVETDSTIKVDQNSEKQAALDFSNALATVAGQFLPLVQAGVISKEAFKSLLSYVMRRFEGSEEVEELLDDSDEQEANPAEQMQQQAVQKEMELADREVGIKEFSAQSKAQYEQRKLDIEENKAILDDMSFEDEMRLRQDQIKNKDVED
jgi:hypothetical protein